MKVCTTILLNYLFCISLLAQNDFEFSTFQRDYQSLENSTRIDDPSEPWDDPDYQIPIGFEFDFFGKKYETLFMDFWTGGLLTFAPTEPYSIIGAYTSDIASRVNTDDQSISPITYEVTGNEGNRIFKMQWKNAGFYSSMDAGNLNDSVNFQLWLYEEDKAIEIIFGDFFVEDNLIAHDDFPGPTSVLAENYFYEDATGNEIWDNFYLLNGESNNPQLDYNSFQQPFLNGNPLPNTVFRFGPILSSNKNKFLEDNYFTLAPNPATESIYISNHNNLPIKKLKISDISGKVISSSKIDSQFYPIKELSAGMYIIQIETKEGIWNGKFVKK